MKKLIGLTGPSSFTNECIQMIERYLEADFVLLYHENQNNLERWLGKCEAFVVAGGVDVHPSLYEHSVVNYHNLTKFDFQRDIRELLVIEHAISNKKPMFGICRGHQLIGLSLGLKSSFCLDLTSSNTIHQAAKGGVSLNRNEPAHYVDLLNPKAIPFNECPERAVLKKIMEEVHGNKIWVNSFHHQGIFYEPKTTNYKDLGIEVLGVSSAEMDNKRHQVIELMRGETWISCQWHPEYDYEVNTPSRTLLDVFKKMIGEQ
jgi:putative glutamine amidotransferase